MLGDHKTYGDKGIEEKKIESAECTILRRRNNPEKVASE